MTASISKNRIVFAPWLDMPLLSAGGCDRLFKPRASRTQKPDGFLIVYLENGEVTWILENENKKLRQIGGTTLLIQPGTLLHAESNLISAEKIFWFHIAGNPSATRHTCFENKELKVIFSKLKGYGNIVFKASQDLISNYACLGRVVSSLNQNPKIPDYLLKARLLVSLILLETTHSLCQEQKLSSEAEDVEKVKAYIQENITEPIGVSDLAKFLGVSVTWITKLFLNYTGMAPAQYLRRQRIRKALDLLAGTKKSITEITHESGFSSSQEFSRVIRKYTDMTPSEYRRQNKNVDLHTAPPLVS